MADEYHSASDANQRHPLPWEGGRGEGPRGPAAGTSQNSASDASQSHPLPREGGRGEGPLQVGPADDGDEGIAIVGGGPAGMALALALARQGGRARIYEARERGAARADPRILALSHGSRQILEWLGVWRAIAATPIAAIHVSQQGGFGRTRLSAAEQGLPALGYVATAASVGAALDDALAAADLPFRQHARVDRVEPGRESLRLVTATDEAVARLVVYAEGMVAAGTAAVTRDYGQSAVICRARTTTVHGNVAHERFTAQGPLALLPIGAELAVVYTCPRDEAERLAALADAAFLARLQEHFGTRLRFSGVSERQVYPLTLCYRKSPVADRSVWLGNAAQTLHPVAGQGFNLALRDAWELARCLMDGEDPGDAPRLARYAAARRTDRMATIGFTDGLVRLFGSDLPLASLGRGIGLLALDLLPPARAFIARRMIFGARAW
ncbi:2-octaprenyl-6-methoxyphenol hydroxylase [mine drainage metagenome]|uniref:2-octaprenyl-6-methoxyphenol hydroxylase n=1 Tax=mine drainage metagenome TaxID=410659 RepID=A0A1J5R165_9ZZZZ